MEGYFSTGQSPQWAVVPVEEEKKKKKRRKKKKCKTQATSFMNFNLYIKLIMVNLFLLPYTIIFR
jgi:hypothetical protein